VGSIVGNSWFKFRKSELIRWSLGANLLEWDEPLALQNTVELVNFQIFDDVGCARWPANLDAVDFGRGAQAKVYAEVTCER
jgi:hypothetical protein